MSYESPVPPVPTREEELAIIEKVKKTFDAQKHRWNHIEMVDAHRLRRIQTNDLISKYNGMWWRNFFRGVIMTIPFAILVARTQNHGPYGVPQYYRSVWYNKGRFSQAFTYVKLRQFKVAAPLMLLVPFVFATAMTD